MAVIAVTDPLLLEPGRGLLPAHLPGHELVAAWEGQPGRPAALAAAEVLLTALAPVDDALLAAAPHLRLVAKPGAGVDNIDVAAAARRGIRVCNAPGTRGQAVAEHVLFAILYLLRRGWDPQGRAGAPLPLDAAGRVLGLVGLGDIGTRVARLAHPFGMELLAATPSQRTRDACTPVRFVPLDTIHRDVDVLVLCAPLTDTTRGLVRSETLAQMRPDAVLVNVARGPCVVTADLVAAMSGGHLHGAALDVTEPEPLPVAHPLRALPNVLLTPHSAGRTVRAQQRALDVMVAQVLAVLAGQQPRHEVRVDDPARAASGAQAVR